MSLKNAEENLKELGKELKLGSLEFNKESNTCVLAIDDAFSLHLTYESTSDYLYLYCPLLDGLPKDDKTKLALYETLLQGAILGAQMAGGGVGVAVEDDLILMHRALSMEHAVPSTLSAFCPMFIDSVEKWRKAVVDVIEGRKPDVDIVFNENRGSSKEVAAKNMGGQFLRG